MRWVDGTEGRLVVCGKGLPAGLWASFQSIAWHSMVPQHLCRLHGQRFFAWMVSSTGHCWRRMLSFRSLDRHTHTRVWPNSL